MQQFLVKNYRTSFIFDRRVIEVILFMSGIMAVQRVSFSPFNALICIIPLMLAIILKLSKSNVGYYLSCLALSLVYSIDNGAEAYAETPASLRYFIYLLIFLSMVVYSRPVIRRREIFFVSLLVIWLIVGSILNFTTNIGVLNFDILKRDFIILILVGVLLLEKKSGRLDLSFLLWGGLGLLIGEIVNLLFYYSSNTTYLSYDTTKVFIIFPVIYSFTMRRHYLISAALSVITMYILFFLGSRMIVISITGLCLLAALYWSLKSRKLIIIITAALVIWIIGSRLDYSYMLEFDIMNSFKAFGFLTQILINMREKNILEILQLLDPVRYSEYILFLDRPWYEILIGQGPGSGIYDAKGTLNFIHYNQTAFGDSELSSSTFFNFHDYIIDYGLRFGLLPVIYISYMVTFHHFNKGRYAVGLLMGMLLINVTYSTSGIFLIAMFHQFYLPNLSLHTRGNKTPPWTPTL